MRCVSRSFALRAEQKNGERSETEIQTELVRAKEEEAKEKMQNWGSE